MYSSPNFFGIAIALLFSGEESYGKYLDLYVNHTAYNNLKNIGKRPGYLQYLDLLLAAQSNPVHSELSKETRFTKDFETWGLILSQNCSTADKDTPVIL